VTAPSPFALVALTAVAAMAGGSDAAFIERFARLSMECIHKEYPSQITHVMSGDGDVRPPRELTPVFYGCYDWHSAVHGHWLLARLARLHPEAPFAPEALEALGRSFTPARIEGEIRYLQGEGRTAFERPYGLAWLLQLGAELREWDDPRARSWSEALRPLEAAARERLAGWPPKLSYPIRSGEHFQTAFAFGLILDWARTARDRTFEDLIVARIRALYLGDRDCPMAYEPGGQDFLSPCLAEADLLRRILPPEEYAAWLTSFLPAIPRSAGTAWLVPAVVTDPGDPKLAHLDGLNLSRAWMLEGMAAGLPPGDSRIAAIRAAAAEHSRKGLAAVTGDHYEGGHWLGSFAVYLVSRRGLAG